MSFARRAVVVVLFIQLLVIVREVVFEIGLDRFLGSIGSNPIFLVVLFIGIADIALIVPVSRGNRWATLAALPMMVLLLLAALPIWLFVFGNPSEDNFAAWFTLTVGVLASAIGIPFGIVATLESFGRRSITPTTGPGFSASGMFTVAVIGAVVGMMVLALAVAASPGDAGTAFDEPPDGYASVTMRDLRFAPEDLQITGDQATAVFVTNEDPFEHSFDIDALDVHVVVPGGQTKVVMVDPEAGASFELYCAVPGHRDGGMVGRVVAQ